MGYLGAGKLGENSVRFWRFRSWMEAGAHKLRKYPEAPIWDKGDREIETPLQLGLIIRQCLHMQVVHMHKYIFFTIWNVFYCQINPFLLIILQKIFLIICQPCYTVIALASNCSTEYVWPDVECTLWKLAKLAYMVMTNRYIILGVKPFPFALTRFLIIGGFSHE